MDFKHLAAKLSARSPGLAPKKVAMGFDGFVDDIVRVVNKKERNHPTTWITGSREFGQYILERSGRNFSLELDVITTKYGGNMPIMASAMAHAGVNVQCVGAFGYPAVHTVFLAMPAACQLHTFSEPGTSTALEFNDGKIILGKMAGLNSADWPTIRERIGTTLLHSIFEDTNLTALLNWSELENSTGIWKGLLQDLTPPPPGSKERILFFDLSDCSKKSKEDITEALGLIKAFAGHFRIVLGLNQNEGHVIENITHPGTRPEGDFKKLGLKLFDKLGVDILLLHNAREALVCSSSGLFIQPSFPVKSPLFSTGAGDNFNAGFCLGLLMDLSLDENLAIAHATANQYVRYGKSPDVKGLTDFFEKTE